VYPRYEAQTSMNRHHQRTTYTFLDLPRPSSSTAIQYNCSGMVVLFAGDHAGEDVDAQRVAIPGRGRKGNGQAFFLKIRNLAAAFVEGGCGH
jgi:hypothetical protein